jgi:hypothetical protein
MKPAIFALACISFSFTRVEVVVAIFLSIAPYTALIN